MCWFLYACFDEGHTDQKAQADADKAKELEALRTKV